MLTADNMQYILITMVVRRWRNLALYENFVADDDFYFIRHATKDNKNATYLTITIGRRTVIFDLHFMHL